MRKQIKMDVDKMGLYIVVKMRAAAVAFTNGEVNHPAVIELKGITDMLNFMEVDFFTDWYNNSVTIEGRRFSI